MEDRQKKAFPLYDPQSNLIQWGMDKRFYAACCAMQGLLASTNEKSLFVMATESKTTHFIIEKSVAQMAYLIADELLKQENE